MLNRKEGRGPQKNRLSNGPLMPTVGRVGLA